MDSIMIPKKSHLTSIGVTAQTRCPSLKIMQLTREK